MLVTKRLASSAAQCASVLKTPQIGVILLLLLVLSKPSLALEAKITPKGCLLTNLNTPGLNVDDSTDVHAVDKYMDAVGQLLNQERFDDLDCLADSLRSNKTRFSGGMWKLHILYAGLDEPRLHPTEEDWQDHLGRLRRWAAASPDSITARVALAKSYTNYGWEARGEETADKVSQSGWRLFGERVQEARQILEEASTLRTKCPEWYLAMQAVAQAQGWDVAQARALLQQGMSFEPGYYYFYRSHAAFLKPQWYGRDGESEEFAEEISDQIGGERGDVTYFQIASSLICHCGEESSLKRLSWPRIQRGFALLEKQYGNSLLNMNLFAFMAVKYKDPVVADKLFARIGDNWDEDTWRKQGFYEANKKWAAQVAPGAAWQRSVEDAADANMRTTEGQHYRSTVHQKFSSLTRECIQEDSPRDKFAMFIRVGKQGSIEQIVTSTSTTVSDCMFQKLLQFAPTGPAPFPAPPQPAYWIKLDVDPTSVRTISAR